MAARILARTACAVAMLVLFLAPAARADLVDMGGSTIDTETGLEWLDLTESVNLTPLSILFGDEEDQLYAAGWRYASFAQISTLLTHAGLSAPFLNTAPQNPPATAALIGLLGITLADAGSSASIGYAPQGVASVWEYWNMCFIVVSSDGTSAVAWVPGPFLGLGADLFPRADCGNFLVRPTSPTSSRRTSWGQLKERYR